MLVGLARLRDMEMVASQCSFVLEEDVGECEDDDDALALRASEEAGSLSTIVDCKVLVVVNPASSTSSSSSSFSDPSSICMWTRDGLEGLSDDDDHDSIAVPDEEEDCLVGVVVTGCKTNDAGEEGGDGSSCR